MTGRDSLSPKVIPHHESVSDTMGSDRHPATLTVTVDPVTAAAHVGRERSGMPSHANWTLAAGPSRPGICSAREERAKPQSLCSDSLHSVVRERSQGMLPVTSPDSIPTPRQYRRMLKKKRAQHIKCVHRELKLELGFSNRLVSEGWRGLMGIEPHDDVRGIGASLAMSSMATYDALVQLVSSGHDEPALMVWRPMFERMLTAPWSERHPKLAEQRFEELHRHTQLRSNRIAVDMPALTHGQIPFPPAESGEEERLKKIFGEYGTRGVTGRPMHGLVQDMAKDLDEFQA